MSNIESNGENWKRSINECHYNSPEEFLYFYVLNGCGCGNGRKLAKIAWEVFELFALKSDKRWEVIYGKEGDESKALVYEAMAQWLDSKKLIAHGTSIAGSWLSKEGNELYEALKNKPQSEEPEDGVYRVNIGMI